MSEIAVSIKTEYIRLDQLLKLSGAVTTGGAAKEAVQIGLVLVNGEKCTERGRKLRPGDRIEYSGRVIRVTLNTLP